MEVKQGSGNSARKQVDAEWSDCDISDLCLLQRGFDITEATKKHGSVPVYSSSGLAYYHAHGKVQPPAVITGRKGILGKVFFVSEFCWPHDTTLWVKDFKGNDPRFVAIFLEQFHLERFDAATSVPTLNRNNLSGYPIRLPPPCEQRAIASALSDVDGLLDGLQRLIAKKRDLKQAAMQQLLTGQSRLPGFQGEWNETTLGEIGECTIGLTYKPENVVKHGLLVLRSSNVQNGRIAYDDNVYVNLEVAEHLYTQVGDLLICVRNGSRALIGKCAVIDQAAAGLTFGAFMAMYRTKHWRFVVHAFQGDDIQRQIRDNIGATINQITNKDMKGFRIKLPPAAEQDAIAEVLGDMDAELTALEERLDKTRSLKHAMMQELLTGRIRLV